MAEDIEPEVEPTAEQEAAEAEFELPDHIMVKSLRIDFLVPSDLFLKLQAINLYATDELLCHAAALAVCWPKLGRKVKIHDGPKNFGRRAAEFLVGELKWDLPTLRMAGTIAAAKLVATIPREDEEQAAETF